MFQRFLKFLGFDIEITVETQPPKYIVSQDGFGEYFIREVCDFDSDYSWPLFKTKTLMNMAQVETAITEYEEFRNKSIKKEVKRIY